MTINVWSKVAVAVQTALASAKTITAITKANPGVATSVAHGYADGDILLGDIVVAINEHAVDDYDDLFNAFDRYNIGDEVTVTLLRERQRVQVKLRLVDVQ